MKTMRLFTSKGLSPRVRGNQFWAKLQDFFQRSIPAGAGEPGGGGLRRVVAGVYPRGCGGTPCQECGEDRMYGLSPRVRGNRLLFR